MICSSLPPPSDSVADRAVASCAHLYFHIPFCPKLCPYCSFYVDVGGKNRMSDFVDALLMEFEEPAKPIEARTIYFGGGTPTALPTELLSKLCARVRSRINLDALEEWTIEANPSTIGERKAQALFESGVTRISLGVQSWDDQVLKTLGRTHNARQAEETIATLRNAGLKNINIDLMFGVPGQTIDQWRETLDKSVGLAPAHISTYCLTYEEDTAYFRKLQAGEFRQDDAEDALFFETTMDRLGAAGYGQYEISNFAKSGYESRHNQSYWHGANYRGFGPSAFSTIDLHRWQNIADTAEYVRRVLNREPLATFSETLTPDVRRAEILAFGMRTRTGVAKKELREFPDALEQFLELGFIEERDARMVLTREGRLMADSVGAAFFQV